MSVEGIFAVEPTTVALRWYTAVWHQTERARSALESGLLYIKRVSEICSDSDMFFHFFPWAVSYAQIIYKWVGMMAASWGMPDRGESLVIDTLPLAERQLLSSEVARAEDSSVE